MHRTIVIVRAGLIEPTAKTCFRQQWIGARCAVIKFQPMGRTVIISPGDALIGSYRDLRRRESKVGDRDFRALLRWTRRMRYPGEDGEGERASQKDSHHSAQRPEMLSDAHIPCCDHTIISQRSPRFAVPRPC